MVIVHKVWGKGTVVKAGGKVYRSGYGMSRSGGGSRSVAVKEAESPLYTPEGGSGTQVAKGDVIWQYTDQGTWKSVGSTQGITRPAAVPSAPRAVPIPKPTPAEEDARASLVRRAKQLPPPRQGISTSLLARGLREEVGFEQRYEKALRRAEQYGEPVRSIRLGAQYVAGGAAASIVGAPRSIYALFTKPVETVSEAAETFREKPLRTTLEMVGGALIFGKLPVSKVITDLPPIKQRIVLRALTKDMPPAEAKAFKAKVSELRKVGRRVQPPVKEIDFNIVLENPKVSRIAKSYVKEKGHTVGGSVGQQTQLYVPRRPPRDIDLFTKGPAKTARELASKFREAGIKDVTLRTKKIGTMMESGKIFVGGKKIEFHTDAWRKAFAYAEKPVKTPEGIKVVRLREQALRKSFGIKFGARVKDIPDVKRVVASLKRSRELGYKELPLIGRIIPELPIGRPLKGIVGAPKIKPPKAPEPKALKPKVPKKEKPSVYKIVGDYKSYKPPKKPKAPYVPYGKPSPKKVPALPYAPYKPPKAPKTPPYPPPYKPSKPPTTYPPLKPPTKPYPGAPPYDSYPGMVPSRAPKISALTPKYPGRPRGIKMLIGERKVRKPKKTKRKISKIGPTYKPSLLAIIGGVTAKKAPKRVTGLGIRPIIRNSKRRRLI